MKLLLDTCTFLWITSASKKISKAAEAAFLDQMNDCYLSAASSWEIAIKCSAGRLVLPTKAHLFVTEARERSGIETLAIDEEAALHTSRLPHLHADPFDRMLIAQALVHGMTILTPDELIAQYPVRVLW